MFNPARWRTDKSNKITALFKLRFHATEVSQFGGNALVLSLVPVDNGKPTAKLEKSVIKDQRCYWENPVFERVKLVQDNKTGQIHDKIYHFIISTRSSKYSIVGDVTLNIAEYFTATDAASVSLPFKSSDSDAVLHISIQRIEENAIERELDDEAARIRSQEDRSLKKHLSIGDAEESITKVAAEQEEPLRKTVSSIADLNTDRRAASTGSDITLSSCGSSCGLDTPRDNNNNNGLKNGNNMLLDLSKQPNQQRTARADWALASIHDQLSTSTDDSANSPRDAFSSERSQLVLDESAGEKLKSDLIALSRKAEMSELELNTLRKQIVKESKRIQELLKEVATLKEERDAVKEDYEKLKASSKRIGELKGKNTLGYDGDPWTLLDETRQELSYEKNLNSNLRIQLMKTQESNTELIMAVQDLEHMLDLKNSETCGPPPPPASTTTNSVSRDRSCEKFEEVEEVHDSQCPSSDVDEEQQALEEIVKQHCDAKDTYILEQKIMDLCSEIEMYRRDKDELEMQMEQLALDYEIVKQENHEMTRKLDKIHMSEQLNLPYEKYSSSSPIAAMKDLHSQVQQLENELKLRSDDYSNSLKRIKELERHVGTLEDELDRQAEGFKATLDSVSHAKAENERLAVEAEEALRLTRSELESRIRVLEDKLQKQSKEFSNSSTTIKELETHIEELEKDLEEQADGFVADLEALTSAKVAVEKRAIKAEEALRLCKLRNANTAEMLQDEFNKLSMQMQSTFEANARLASKALTEASELRLLNIQLEDELRRTKEEAQLVRDEREGPLIHLRGQKISSKLKQIDQLVEDIQKKLNQMQGRGDLGSEVYQCLSVELAITRDEIKSVTSDTALCGQEEQVSAPKDDELDEAKLPEQLNESNSGGEHDTDSAVLLEKMELMRVQNTHMESELKEMQDRYSELSLKFAEVEGDRQRLMMTLRTLKNARKN